MTDSHSGFGRTITVLHESNKKEDDHTQKEAVPGIFEVKTMRLIAVFVFAVIIFSVLRVLKVL